LKDKNHGKHYFLLKGQPTKQFNTDMYGRIFRSYSVWCNFCIVFFPETVCRQPGEPPRTIGGLLTILW